ncbi:hypothetical protein B0H10DRAFT_1965790 [Mycena sp. CBHHK59/15]|nr:hypothetical protein B0H10DRAFT_1965790 [Mycena sp. CBHHK59/15]
MANANTGDINEGKAPKARSDEYKVFSGSLGYVESFGRSAEEDSRLPKESDLSPAKKAQCNDLRNPPSIEQVVFTEAADLRIVFIRFSGFPALDVVKAGLDDGPVNFKTSESIREIKRRENAGTMIGLGENRRTGQKGDRERQGQQQGLAVFRCRLDRGGNSRNWYICKPGSSHKEGAGRKEEERMFWPPNFGSVLPLLDLKQATLRFFEDPMLIRAYAGPALTNQTCCVERTDIDAIHHEFGSTSRRPRRKLCRTYPVKAGEVGGHRGKPGREARGFLPGKTVFEKLVQAPGDPNGWLAPYGSPGTDSAVFNQGIALIGRILLLPLISAWSAMDAGPKSQSVEILFGLKR